MPNLSLATFNTHYGVRPARRPPAEPYDLHAALAALDTDVIVLQEVWRPNAQRGRADEAAAALGYELEYVVTGPATTDARWPPSDAARRRGVGHRRAVAGSLPQVGRAGSRPDAG